MAINEAVNIDIDVNGTSTVKQAANAYEDLGDAVSQTQLEAEKLAQQFGINDKRTQEAIKVAGRYKQEMEELDFAIDAARGGSDQLFRAAQGVTAGFELAAGATALFGVESEQLEKMLLKVQGAMVFSQGLRDLKEFAPAVLNAATAIKTQLVTAFTTLRGAIAATGIGALIVALGVAIERVSAYNSAIERTIDDEIELARVRREESLESLDKAEAAFQRAMEIRLLMAERDGASQQKLRDLEIRLLQERRTALREFAFQEGTTFAERAKALQQYNAINDSITRKQLERQIQINNANKEAAKLRRERQAEIQKEIRLENERQNQVESARIKNTETQLESDKIVFDSASFLAKAQQQYADNTVKRLEEEAKAREELYWLSQDLGNAVVSLLGEQTAAGKAVALAQIAADTARALSGALANANSPTPDNVASGGLAGIAKYIALATTIATNAKRAIDIVKSENVTGAASGSASLPSGAGATGFQAPSVRLPRTEQFTGQQRIYVTEYDISNTQEKVRVTEDVSIVK